ncbi:hypothetical protein LCGC14_0401270 [marine sediment metagenome]|uniref:Zinc-hook domain-containing protein n=1 Tax=marine sediment metagenome TaxID=412755 RepID=A0A0F9T2H4_9ZZZZ
MIPEELELQNFLAYRDPDPLVLNGIHVACLAGPNGAGKSSILDAITWSLWGKARSNSADELIHQGQDNMRVALVFRQDGAHYRVIRQRKAGKRGASLLELQSSNGAGDWQGLSGATIKETQSKIDDLLHLDYDTFINSAMLAQGRADEFTTKTPSQRKQILGNILGLSIWEDYEDRAKKRVAMAKSELSRLDSKLAEIETELAKRDDLEDELAIAEVSAGEIDEELQAAEKEWASLKKADDTLSDLSDQLARLTTKIRALKKQIADAEKQRDKAEAQADEDAIRTAMQDVEDRLGRLAPLEVEREELLTRRAAIAEEIGSLKGANKAMAPAAAPLKERMATLQSATEPVCPTCGEPLTEEHRAEVAAEIEHELQGLRDDRRANQIRIDEFDQQLAELDSQKKKLDRDLKGRSKLEKQVGELQVTLERAGEARERMDSLIVQMQQWKVEQTVASEETDELNEKISEARELLGKRSLSEGDLERLRKERRTADQRVGSTKQKLEALEQLEGSQKDLRDSRDETADDLGIYDELRKAFSKTGVPAMIIETAVPELERSANELLSRMTDGRMHVRIETQREIKTGETREALDIVISDELGSRPYELYSGGESFRIDFALRIALSRLLARRAGAQLRSLFIDEGFGSQDAQGRDHLVAAIHSIQDDFERILVITHIEELKDAFPDRIEIEKHPDGSQFRIA